MYLLVLSENLKTSLCSITTVSVSYADTFSFRSKVNTLKPHFVREKKSTSWWISTPLFFCPYSLQALPMVQWL